MDHCSPFEPQAAEQLKRLLQNIRVLRPPPPILVVCRPQHAWRRQAGEIAKVASGAVALSESSLLLHDYLQADRTEALFDLLRQLGEEVTTLVLVTSPGLTSALPCHIVRRHWQRIEQLQPLEPGQMRLLDLNRRTVLHPNPSR